MRLKFHYFLIIISLLGISILGQNTDSTKKEDIENSVSNPQDVDFCNLMKEPEIYVGKYIKVEAIFGFLITNETILRKKCESKIKAVSANVVKEKVIALLDELSSAKVYDGKIIAIGKFLGSEKPDSKYNYGHYGWSKYRFEIHDFEKVERNSEQ